jgi:hypothetical protein
MVARLTPDASGRLLRIGGVLSTPSGRREVMPRLPIAIAVTFGLLPAASALVNACSDPSPPHAESSAAQQRFQTNFCYKQYRDQSDVTRCLARGL